MKRILLMPDKFKGSLSAKELCEIMKEEISKIKPSPKLIVRPMADGGDGTLDILKEVLDLELVNIDTVDPLNRPLNAYYYYHKETAFIELAIASGHAVLRQAERNPMHTSTFGTGLIIKQAIERGLKTIYLFLGGSSTNDAGIGILHALGVDFYDKDGHSCPPTGDSLSKIKKVDTSNIVDMTKVQFIVVTDVKNPMYGPQGAAHIYARQKGASEEEIHFLDQGLKNFGNLVEDVYQRKISSLEGGGAAGGIAAGLSAFLPIIIKPGFDELSHILGLESLVQKCDIIITGEGRLDDQTASGKVISGACELAKKYSKSVYAFVGDNSMNPAVQEKLGITKVYAITDIAPSMEDAIKNPKPYLRRLLHTFTSDLTGN